MTQHVDNAKQWSEGPVGTGQGLLRADFDFLADFLTIDLLCDDDDIGFVKAFDVFNTLLGSQFGDCRGDNLTPSRPKFARVTITRPTADIAYALAGGITGEGLFLDNLQVNLVSVPEPSTFALFATGLAGLGFMGWRRKPKAA